MVNSGVRHRVDELIRNGHLMINDGYRAKNSELGAEGIPFARAGNINKGFHFEEADRFPEENLHKVGKKRSAAGDVVFTSKGTVGRFAFVRNNTPHFVYSPQLCFWRSLNPKIIDNRWLYFWMHSEEFSHQFRGVAGQTDMAEYVSLRDQRAMYITLPSIEIQRNISYILGSLDDKIEANRQMNETLGASARAIFHSWFVDFDPVRTKVEGRQPFGIDSETAALFPDAFEESEMGKMPKGWKIKSLDAVATFLNGLAMQKYPADSDDFLPVIKIAEMRKGSTEGADRASTDIPPDYVVNDGDILFSWSGSLEVVPWCGGRGALNQHLFKVTSSEYPKWFYYQWIRHHLSDFQAIAADKATTMGHIKRHHLSDAKVVVPPKNLIEKMTATMQPLLDLYIANNLESRTLAVIRDTLLPKLLAGTIVPSVSTAK